MIENLIKKVSQGKPKNKVGLDIGSYALKIVEISGLSEKAVLVGAGLRKIQGSSTKENLADSIKALTEESRISAKDINISITGPSVIVRFISMPRMKAEELKGAVRFEAEKFIPFNINDCIVDFQILKRDEKENKLDILLVAAKKDHVEERIMLVESCGFSVNVIDVDSFALVNSFRRNHSTLNSDKTVGLLNIGATLTNISILKGDTLCLVRDVAIGGNDFDSAISKSVGVDAGSIETLKLSPQEKSQEIIACTRAILNNLADEIRSSCSYYENQCGRNVDEFYLSGGSAGLAGLEEFLQEAFGSKPLLWNPMEFLDIDSKTIDMNLLDKMKGSFSVSIGLALR